MEALNLEIINQYLGLFMAAVQAAAVPLGFVGAFLLQALMGISVVFFAVAMGVGVGDLAQGSWTFWKWFLRLWVICTLGSNWVSILQALMETGIGVGAMAGGFQASDFLVASKIMESGFRLLDPIWAHRQMLCTGPYSCVVNGSSLLAYEIAWYFIFISFAAMTAHIVVAQIIFMYHGLTVLAVLGTAAVPQAAWVSERGLGGLIANTIHLLVLGLVMGIGFAIFDQIELQNDVTMNQAWITALVAVIQAWISWKAKSITDMVLNGGPSLHGGSALNSVAGAMLSALGAARMGSAVASVASQAAGSGHQLLYGSGSTPGGSGGPGGGGAALSGGGGAFHGLGGTGSGWRGVPTAKQQGAAAALGANIQGMNRGQASKALEAAGHEASWYRGGGGGGQHSLAAGGGAGGGSAPGGFGSAMQAVRERGLVNLASQGTRGALRAASIPGPGQR